MEQGGFDKICLCRCLRCINLLLSASKMQICGEFSEGTKSPEVDQFCLFHRSNSASHEAQTGIMDLTRPERPCCVCDRCSPHEKFTISVILFFPTCSCACICLGADRAADVLSAKNSTHVSLHSSKTVLNPPSSPVLLHCVAPRLEAIYYALASLPESLHRRSI